MTACWPVVGWATSTAPWTPWDGGGLHKHMCGYNTMSFITLTCAVGQAFRKGAMGCRWSLLHEAWGLSYEDWEAGGHLVARLGDHLRACSTLLSGRWCWLLARTSAGVLSPSTSVWPRHVACASSHHGGLGEAVLPTWGLGAPKGRGPGSQGGGCTASASEVAQFDLCHILFLTSEG